MKFLLSFLAGAMNAPSGWRLGVVSLNSGMTKYGITHMPFQSRIEAISVLLELRSTIQTMHQLEKVDPDTEELNKTYLHL